MKAKLSGNAPADYDRRVREATAEGVRQQAEAGIDIVSDGEQSKPGFFTYVQERLGGFEPRADKQVEIFPLSEGARIASRRLWKGKSKSVERRGAA
jgi:5-methyltetrahydropteroyltriglutamate--homocysteine methyltransferase